MGRRKPAFSLGDWDYVPFRAAAIQKGYMGKAMNTARGVDGGALPIPETDHTGKPKEQQALIESLERLITQWRRHAETLHRALNGAAWTYERHADELEALLKVKR